MKHFSVCMLVTIISLPLFAQNYQPTWESLDKRPVPDWFGKEKFGIFIHWGVYAVPAYTQKGNYAEWYQHQLHNKSFNGAVVNYHQKRFGPDVTYYQLAPLFKAELYKPDEWAKVIEQSGAKYVVLTSKHHDGYALWPSKEASATWGFPWNASEVGPKRDLLGDLFIALRKTSVRPGMYYSLYEWFNPLWLNDKPRYVQQHMWPQMKELINTYQPDVFWTDGEWDAPDTLWKSKEFLTWVFNESTVKDRIVVNDRWGAGIRFHHAGVYTPEYQPDMDFEDHAFEESRGMGYSYGYNREEDAWDYNSAQVMVLHLVDKVSRGGNFLLDIGPDAHGKIPPIMQERLLQIGRWMSANGEAIYDTRRWRTPVQWSEGRRDYKMPPHAMVDDWKTGGDVALKLTLNPDSGYAVKECFFTYNPASNNLYALFPKWPANGRFIIKDFTVKPGTVIELLEGKRDVSWKQEGKNLVLELPPVTPGYFSTDYLYVIKITDAGKFTNKPAISVNYPGNPTQPVVTIVPKDQKAVIHYTLDGSIPTEQSALYTKPFNVERNASLKVKAFSNGSLPSDLVTSEVIMYNWMPAVKIKGLKKGLQYKAFELTATSVTELQLTEPVKEGIASSIGIEYATRKAHMGLRFRGYINIPADGLYAFHLTSDDGSVLHLDNKVLINHDGTHGSEEKSASVALKKGYHLIAVDYFNATGGSDLKLMMSSRGMEKMIIPGSMLFSK